MRRAGRWRSGIVEIRLPLCRSWIRCPGCHCVQRQQQAWLQPLSSCFSLSLYFSLFFLQCSCTKLSFTMKHQSQDRALSIAGSTRLLHVKGDCLWAYRLASCGGDRQIFYWDVATGKVIRKFRGHDGIVNSVSFTYLPVHTMSQQ